MRILAGMALLSVAAFSGGCVRGMDRREPATAMRATTLVVADRVDHVDVLAREPMIVEHPDGTLFVSGYGESAPTLWKSRDHGASWARVNVGTGKPVVVTVNDPAAPVVKVVAAALVKVTACSIVSVKF